jgi:tetratricopeptide (TPR) repeat protein
VTAPEPGSEPDPVTVPLIWGNVPQRNINFTGRDYLLTELRRRVTALSIFPAPHALYGLAGAGKTQLAIEYAYRFARHYQAIWWIPADNMAVVRSSMAALAPQLGLTGLAPGRIEESVSAVLSALRRGEPYSRWLIVFDNADLPGPLRSILPIGSGHVIVTTRDRSWAQVVDALEVGVFARDESTQFVSRRVPGITDEDTRRLAEVFGDLPLGLEHAVMWLTQTAITADSYLALLDDRDSRLLAESPGPSDYPAPVAAAWNLSIAWLRSEAPHAMELLRCCAFFGAAPVPLDLLEHGHLPVESPLRQLLDDQVALGRAIRALGRHSLVRVDAYRRTLEVHRVVQRLIRDELDADGYRDVQHEVHMILAEGNPGDPDSIENWPKYSELSVHLGPAEIVSCRGPEVRRLARNMVRYLLVTGNHTSALASADKALTRWTGDSGEEDQDVLIMTRLKIQVLQALARYEEAYELTRSLLDRMRLALGEDHEQTLILMNCHCIDLWARGEYTSSLSFTEATLENHLRVLGSNHPRTFAALNNYAEDLELNGSYSAASAIHREVYAKKLDIYGVDHPRTLFTLGALGRTVLAEGRFGDARTIAEQAHDGFRQLVRRHVLADSHPWVLQQAVDLSAAWRAAGAITEALALAEEIYSRCRRAYFGSDHPRTLAAAVNLGNAQRAAGDTQSARRLLDDTTDRYAVVFGPAHPYTLACAVDLAVAHRCVGDVSSARGTLETTADGLAQRLTRDHHHSLICMVNLASALSEAGEIARAIQCGESAVEGLGSLLGQDHPHALACAANLALDLTAAGQEQRVIELAPDVAERCRSAFGHEHPVVRAISTGQRLDLEIELHATF